MPKQSMAFTYN